MVDLATRVMLGAEAEGPGLRHGACTKRRPTVAVKVPVFSFEKLTDANSYLGPEMKSTGEVLGIGRTLNEALFKGLICGGLPPSRSAPGRQTGVLAERGRTRLLRGRWRWPRSSTTWACSSTPRRTQRRPSPRWASTSTVVTSIGDDDGEPSRCWRAARSATSSTPARCCDATRATTTSRCTARRCAEPRRLPDLAGHGQRAGRHHRQPLQPATTPSWWTSTTCAPSAQTLRFAKMQATRQRLYLHRQLRRRASPARSRCASRLCDRHYGIGGDGIVLIEQSDVADAKMRIFNRDGSRGQHGRQLHPLRGEVPVRHTASSQSENMTIETASGVQDAAASTRCDGRGHLRHASTWAVPSLDPPARARARLPGGARRSTVPVVIGGRQYRVTCVSHGQPALRRVLRPGRHAGR